VRHGVPTHVLDACRHRHAALPSQGGVAHIHLPPGLDGPDSVAEDCLRVGIVGPSSRRCGDHAGEHRGGAAANCGSFWKDVNLDVANLPWPQGIAAARSTHASAHRFQQVILARRHETTTMAKKPGQGSWVFRSRTIATRRKSATACAQPDCGIMLPGPRAHRNRQDSGMRWPPPHAAGTLFENRGVRRPRHSTAVSPRRAPTPNSVDISKVLARIVAAENLEAIQNPCRHGDPRGSRKEQEPALCRRHCSRSVQLRAAKLDGRAGNGRVRGRNTTRGHPALFDRA
jgi:hypothetical protein